MENAFLAQSRVWRTRAVAAAIGLMVLIVVAVLVGHHGGGRGGSGTSNTGASTAAGPAPAGGRPSPQTTDSTARVGPVVQMVPGRRRANGVAVGYPHSVAGAVSAANEYSIQLGSTLDPERAAAIAAAIVDPATGLSVAFLAQGPVNSRRSLGLPLSGPVLVGASMSHGPVSYQIRDAERDHVLVLLLGYLSTITPAQGLRNRIGVFPIPMVWSLGDWKIGPRADEAPDYAELRFAPGSAEAVAAGWLPLTA